MSHVTQVHTRPNHHLRRTITRWSKRVVLGLAVIGVIALLVRSWMPQPIAVDVATVTRGPLEVTVDEDGRTRVHERFVVAAPLAGNLARITLEPGDAVTRGQPIARIAPMDPAMLDPRTRAQAQAQLDGALARQRQADAAIARARAAEAVAQKDVERDRTLEARGAATGSQRERSELAATLASGDLAAATEARLVAQADVAAARALLGGGGRGASPAIDVVAPVTGRVLRVLAPSATPVAPGAPLVELGDPRALEVVVDVLSSDAARIAPGAIATIDQWGGERALTGRVRTVEPSAFTKISALGVEEQRVNVVVALDQPPPALGDGFRVEVHVRLWRGERVRVAPSSAVFRDHGRWAVYAVEDGHARLRTVELGHRGRVDVEIASGLDDGAQVVLRPGDRVRDGAAVMPR